MTDEDKKKRRSVACKSCHSLKVKCTPSDINNPAGPCVRCLNTKRVCEIDLNQPRKRRRKAEILEAREAEKKQYGDHFVDSNNNNIINDNGSMKSEEFTPPYFGWNQGTPRNGTSQSNGSTGVNGSGVNSIPGNNTLTPGTPQSNSNGNGSIGLNTPSAEETIVKLQSEVAALKAQLSSLGGPVDEFISKKDLQAEMKILNNNDHTSAFMKLSNDLKDSAHKRSSFILDEIEAIDVVLKKVITIEDAEMRLNIFQDRFHTKFPYIDVPPDSTAETLRHSQPYLFNAIMCVTSLVLKEGDESTNQVIEIIATKYLMMQVFLAGNKTEEYLKALILLGFWYNSPELVKQRRFHLLNALAIGLLHDLGIVVKTTDDGTEAPVATDQHRKIIMLLYVGTVTTCLILRRTIYVKWTPYVEECCAFLENSSDFTLNSLAILSRLNHILEKIHNSIHCSDTNVDGAQNHWIIKELQDDLNLIRAKIFKTFQNDNRQGIMAYYHSVEAYLHEPLLTQVAGLNADGTVFLKTEAIKAISTCTTACVNCLESFSLMGPERIACVPLLYLSRIIYTAGMLLRLRFLILSFPLHIEKNLVPINAIDVVQKTNLVFLKSAELHPFNYCIKKISLMLQLFIQTYANQVNTLLNSGKKPHNFKDLGDHLVNDILWKPNNYGVLTSNSGVAMHPHVPLDVLSYAAAFRRSLKHGDTKSSLQDEMAYDKEKTDGKADVKNELQTQLLTQIQNQLVNPLTCSTNNDYNQAFNMIRPTGPHRPRPPMTGPVASIGGPAHPPQIPQGFQGPSGPPGPPGPLPGPQGTQAPGQQPIQPGMQMPMPMVHNDIPIEPSVDQEGYYGVPGFDELDNNFIGEEFWGDIVNPGSSNFNFSSKGTLNDVFFMA